MASTVAKIANPAVLLEKWQNYKIVEEERRWQCRKRPCQGWTSPNIPRLDPRPPCWVWAPACARSRHAGCGPGQHVPAHMAAAANGRAGGAALCGSRRGRQSAGSRGAGPGGLRPGSRRCRAERRERGSLGRDRSGPEAAPGQGRWSSPAERGWNMRG